MELGKYQTIVADNYSLIRQEMIGWKSGAINCVTKLLEIAHQAKTKILEVIGLEFLIC